MGWPSLSCSGLRCRAVHSAQVGAMEDQDLSNDECGSAVTSVRRRMTGSAADRAQMERRARTLRVRNDRWDELYNVVKGKGRAIAPWDERQGWEEGAGCAMRRSVPEKTRGPRAKADSDRRGALT